MKIGQSFQMLNGIKNNNVDKKENKNIFDSFMKKEEKKVEVQGSGMAEVFAEVMKEKSKTEEIAGKIAKGEELSKEELEYIQEKNPELLRKAKVVSKQREELEREVKSAKTPKDKLKVLSKAKMNVMSGVDFKNKASIELVALQLKAIQKVEETTGKREENKKIDTLV
ncbi:MAG: hypothetical protein ACRC28_13605 [Clostridium sp.]|uniref:hypothetical protein n=1 Tax=Clostridium sp. TaxID=1506 RepID=UPI003F3FFB10